jgi:hypothetical protein
MAGGRNSLGNATKAATAHVNKLAGPMDSDARDVACGILRIVDCEFCRNMDFGLLVSSTLSIAYGLWQHAGLHLHREVGPGSPQAGTAPKQAGRFKPISLKPVIFA